MVVTSICDLLTELVSKLTDLCFSCLLDGSLGPLLAPFTLHNVPEWEDRLSLSFQKTFVFQIKKRKHLYFYVLNYADRYITNPTMLQFSSPTESRW